MNVERRTSGWQALGDYLFQSIWRELIVVFVLIMEISWLIPWMRVMSSSAAKLSTWINLVIFLAWGLLAMFTNRVLDRRTAGAGFLRQIRQLAIMLVGLFLFTNLFIYSDGWIGPGMMVKDILDVIVRVNVRMPESFFLLPFLLFIWRRGSLQSVSDGTDSFGIGKRFRLGVLSFVGFGLIFPGGQLLFLLEIIPIYFTAGILAGLLSHSNVLSHSSSAYTLQYGPGWVGSVLIILLGAVFTGIVTGWLMRNQLVRIAASKLDSLFLSAVEGLLFLFRPVIQGAAFLVEKLFGFLGSISKGDFFTGLAEMVSGFVIELDRSPVRFEFTPETWIGFLFVLVVVIVLLALRRVRVGRKDLNKPDRDPGEDVFSPDLLQERLDKLVELAQNGLARLRRVRLDGGWFAKTVIRRSYLNLLSLGARHGRQRSDSETPREYQKILEQLFPESISEVAEITSAYQHVRYGELHEHEYMVRDVRLALERVRLEAGKK
jgi:hypothetical protein